MRDRIKKPPRSLTAEKKAEQRDALLEAILRNAITMKRPCSFCKSRGYTCKSSPSDSSSCYECVARHEPHCDAQGVSLQQLRRITSQYDKYEVEMEEAERARAELDAKINRLRLLKRKWSESMSRALSRGVETVEDLEELERQEAEESKRREAENAAAQPSLDPASEEAFTDPSWVPPLVDPGSSDGSPPNPRGS